MVEEKEQPCLIMTPLRCVVVDVDDRLHNIILFDPTSRRDRSYICKELIASQEPAFCDFIFLCH